MKAQTRLRRLRRLRRRYSASLSLDYAETRLGYERAALRASAATVSRKLAALHPPSSPVVALTPSTRKPV